jgi:hypothetical protein
MIKNNDIFLKKDIPNPIFVPSLEGEEIIIESTRCRITLNTFFCQDQSGT